MTAEELSIEVVKLQQELSIVHELLIKLIAERCFQQKKIDVPAGLTQIIREQYLSQFEKTT